MASLRSFLDSNILVYTDDSRNPNKQNQAENLVERVLLHRSGVISIQVMQEYFSVATRKLKIEPVICRQKLELLSALTVFQPTPADVLAAIDLYRLHQLSFYDAMILRAALQSGCRTLYSEDLQHGARFDSLQVVNPFL